MYMQHLFWGFTIMMKYAQMAISRAAESVLIVYLRSPQISCERLCVCDSERAQYKLVTNINGQRYCEWPAIYRTWIAYWALCELERLVLAWNMHANTIKCVCSLSLCNLQIYSASCWANTIIAWPYICIMVGDWWAGVVVRSDTREYNVLTLAYISKCGCLLCF